MANPNWQQLSEPQLKVWDYNSERLLFGPHVAIKMQPQQSRWSAGSDWDKSDIWLLETCGCNTMLVQGNFEFPECQDWSIRAMHKPSILGRNHCCATRKRVTGSLSLMMTTRDECRWVAASSRRRFCWSSRTRSELCGAWTKRLSCGPIVVGLALPILDAKLRSSPSHALRLRVLWLCLSAR